MLSGAKQLIFLESAEDINDDKSQVARSSELEHIGLHSTRSGLYVGLYYTHVSQHAKCAEIIYKLTA
jgi:hypothetical protein